MEATGVLSDSHGRRINYLRISLTDLCNFRCVYCTPREGLATMPTSKYLVKEEILRFVRIAGHMGITRVRLTGGEPLLRKDIVDIVRSLKSVESVKDLSITTNGSRLKNLVEPLKEAGLDRINISLDSLDPDRFKEITLTDCYQQVMEATFSALNAGFPVKLNMVVLNGLTSEEIIRFVRLAHDFPLEVRFLEFMPLCGSGWRPDLVLAIGTVRDIVRAHFDLKELPRKDNVAQAYEIVGGKGKVGFIASLTESFCDQCSRIRLSADGRIQPCLFSNQEVSVKALLRENAPDEKIMDAIRYAAQIKPRGNWFRDNPFRPDDLIDESLLSTPMIRKIGG